MNLGLSLGLTRQQYASGGGAPSTPAVIEMLSTIALNADVSVSFHSGIDGPPLAMQVVTDALGGRSVIAQPGAFARFTPVSSAGRFGVMANPHRYTPGQIPAQRNTGGTQGFDILFQTQPVDKAQMRTVYDPAKNVGPWLPLDAPISYLSHTPVPTITGERCTKDYGVLTVLASVPPFAFFRPGTSIAAKSVIAKAADVDFSVVREFADDIPNILALTTALNRIAPFRFANGYDGETLRTLSNDTGGTISTYMSTKGVPITQAYVRLHCGPNSDETKRTAILRMVQIGLDRYADYLGGHRGWSGAGQHQIELECMVLAGFALKNTAILDAAREWNANVVGQCKWVSPAGLNYVPGWPTSGGENSILFYPSWKDTYINTPFFFQQNNPMNALHGLTINQRYFETSCPALVPGLLFMLLLRNGPGGISGLDWWLSAAGGNGAQGTTNQRASAVGFLDIYLKGLKLVGDVPAWVLEFYNRHRAEIAMPVWSGPGWIWEGSDGSNVPLTPTANGFSFTYTEAMNYSTGTLTEAETRFSQDEGTQFVTVPGTALSGSVSEVVPGVPLTLERHCVQFRFRNLAPNGTSYWSDWSANFPAKGTPVGDKSDWRRFLAPNGTRTPRAPNVVVQPKMLISASPTTTEPYYYDAPTNLGPNDIALVVGGGYVDSHPVCARQYQLLVNGVPTGARQSDNRFLRTRGIPSGVPIAARVFYNNGTDPEIFADTNAVIYPALQVFPATTIVDTDFGGSLDAQWPGVLDSVTGGNGTAGWSPFRWATVAVPEDLEDSGGEIPQTSVGLIGTQRSSNGAWVRVNLTGSRPLVPGRKYRVEADIPIGYRYAVTGFPNVPYYIRLGTSNAVAIGTTANLDNRIIDYLPAPRIYQYVHEFEAAVGQVELWLLVGLLQSSVANPVISKARVVEIADFTIGALPTPRPTPITLFDKSGAGLVTSDWTSTGDLVNTGTGLALTGTTRRKLTYVNEAMEINRQYRVTAFLTQNNGAITLRQNVGRGAFDDPNYGGVAEVTNLYLSERSHTTTINFATLFRLQSTPIIVLEFYGLFSTTNFTLTRLLIEEL